MEDQAAVEELAVSGVGEKYAELRIIKPRMVLGMERSLVKYGQLSPVVCMRAVTGCEMIDGFKRLHACRRLARPTLTARILTTTERVSKAAIIQLNKTGGSISDLEEAMVLRSLYREDKLTQPELATLFGRHQSWVSRRISLIEALSEEVRQDIKLGLLSPAAGREVARMPRGIQTAAARAIIKHRLTTRETAKLAAYLLSRPSYAHALILDSPWEVLESRERPSGLAARLLSFERACLAMSKALKSSARAEILERSGLITHIIPVAAQTARELGSALSENNI
jgi:ParB-like chromosome segregation protein Spo0J